jgi:hypothetical protein
MRTVYPLFAAQRLRGAAGLEDLATAVVKALAVDTNAYTYSPAHEFLASIPELARVATSPAVGGKTFVGGNFDCSDPVFTFLAGASTVRALVLFLDSGDPETSRLVFYSEDELGLPLVPPAAGGVRTWKLPAAGPFRL